MPSQRYDVVGSFGSIEHFQNPEEIADKHFLLVKPGGYVIVTMPNFGGLGQRTLRWLLGRETLHRHNTRCMNPGFLMQIAKRNNAEITAIRYAGGSFWFLGLSDAYLRALMFTLLRGIGRGLKRVGPRWPNGWFSPFIFAIYKARYDEGKG